MQPSAHAPLALVVDDDPVFRTLLARLLERVGCVVETAGSAGEAVTALRRIRPDLVLVDVRLAGQDGIRLCGRIVTSSACAPPVIVLSGATADDERARSLRAGAAAFVAKPFQPVELLDSVRAVLASCPPNARPNLEQTLSHG